MRHLGDVLVLGLGKSGKSVARYCASLIGSRVDSLFIAAGARNADSEAFVQSVAGAGVDYAFGDDAIDALRAQGRRFSLCIASPGIPFWHDLYVGGQELSDELMSEVEFSWLESDPASIWVAITGTNGKTTTTSCCAHILQECGMAANAVGNIGDVCLDAVIAGQTDVYVAELSSYQLFSTPTFAPDVAVMLNITPDHVHWHKTFEAYRDAKFSMLDNMRKAACASGLETALPAAESPVPLPGTVGSQAEADRSSLRSSSCGTRALRALRQSSLPLDLRSSQPQKGCQPSPEGARGSQLPDEGHAGLGSERAIAILDAANDVVRAKVRELKALSDDERGFDYVPMGTVDGIGGDMRARCGARNAAFIDAGGMLVVALDGVEHAIVNVSQLQIKGAHNASNALAAAAVAVALGADDASIARALTTFAPLEHRIEPCGEVAGVACYNDSKATNVDATLKALEAFPEKGLIVLLGGDDKGTDLSELVAQTHVHARIAVCFGAAGNRFERAFDEAAADAPEGFQVISKHHLEDALDGALELARPGEVVLLSPACASFDEFKSFEERGRVFKQLVRFRAEAARRGVGE